MNEEKDQPRKVSTCLEDSKYAEMIQKIMSEQGIGSLSEERMRSLINTSREAKEEPQDADQEGAVERTNDRADRNREAHAEISPQNGNLIKRRSSMIESLMKLHKCADCSIRCKASRKPRSLYARIHRWHATWWPGWKFYKAEQRARSAEAAPRA